VLFFIWPATRGGRALQLRYLPNLTEFFCAPGKASIQSAIQRMEGWTSCSPGGQREYASAARNAPDVRAPNSIYSALLAAEDGSYGAMVMDMARMKPNG